MKSLLPIFLVLPSLFALPQQLPLRSLEKTSNNTYCSTTPESPYYYQAQGAASIAINVLGDKPCVQSSLSQCTSLVKWGTAEIGICGERGYEILCTKVGEYVERIMEECKEWKKCKEWDETRFVAEGVWATNGKPGDEDFRGVFLHHT
ncbi:hypothetical protein HOY80DRAFT_960796 [Tuber brumale]|nr:hypothetical protein HOY80DRAFT_960796 [Tuber brumale]